MENLFELRASLCFEMCGLTGSDQGGRSALTFEGTHTKPGFEWQILHFLRSGDFLMHQFKVGMSFYEGKQQDRLQD